MARKSRTEKKIEVLESCTLKHIYKAGLYRRLSVEADGDNESEHSIGNQQKLMEDFVSKNPSILIEKVYTDNGITGMTFKRPGFQSMMDDLNAGIIDCVIIKDISRLGRHFVLTSEIVKNVYPSMNVRLVSILDDYDSIDPQSDADRMLLSIKMVMNDYYCKDFSKKIRTSIGVKMDNGEYLPSSSSIPYGYIRNPEQNSFEIDEETAPIVKRIFEYRAEGKNFNEIARIFNEEGLSSPGKIRYERGLTKSEKFANAVWLRGAVRKISQDPVYTGCRIHGKVKRDTLGAKKTRRDQSEWQIIENAHEALVSQELFDLVQEVNEKAINSRKEYTTHKTPDVDKREELRDKVVCADCGSKMTVRKGIGRVNKHTGETNPYFFFDCNLYHKSFKLQCHCHYIRMDDIVESLENCLKTQFAIALDYEDYVKSVKNKPQILAYQKSQNDTVTSLRAKLTNLSAKREKLIVDMAEGILDVSEYEMLRERLEQQYEKVQSDYYRQKSAFEELDHITDKTKVWIESLKKFHDSNVLDKGTIDTLVDKILVYDQNHIQIVLNFADPFNDIYAFVEKVEGEMRNAG